MIFSMLCVREGGGWVGGRGKVGRKGGREREKERERKRESFFTIGPSDLVISIILMLRS